MIDNKTMITALSTILHNNDRYYYSKDGEYSNYVHGSFHFYSEDIKDITKEELENILLELEKEKIWERKYPKHPMVGKVIDAQALKKKISDLKPETINEEEIYEGFKIIGCFAKSTCMDREGEYYFQSYLIDNQGKPQNYISKIKCREVIDHYLQNKSKIEKSESLIHVLEYIGGNGGGFKFCLETFLEEELMDTSYNYYGSLESFIEEIKSKVQKNKIFDDYVWME